MPARPGRFCLDRNRPARSARLRRPLIWPVAIGGSEGLIRGASRVRPTAGTRPLPPGAAGPKADRGPCWGIVQRQNTRLWTEQSWFESRCPSQHFPRSRYIKGSPPRRSSPVEANCGSRVILRCVCLGHVSAQGTAELGVLGSVWEPPGCRTHVHVRCSFKSGRQSGVPTTSPISQEKVISRLAANHFWRPSRGGVASTNARNYMEYHSIVRIYSTRPRGSRLPRALVKQMSPHP